MLIPLFLSCSKPNPEPYGLVACPECRNWIDHRRWYGHVTQCDPNKLKFYDTEKDQNILSSKIKENIE